MGRVANSEQPEGAFLRGVAKQRGTLILLPQMDGVQAVREILRRDPGARVVMVSAMGQQALVVEAIRAGARDFVVKPFDQARLVEAIRRALR